MNKRKILLLATALCMVAILALGGTLAFFTDTDNQVNTFTVGKVRIVQNEKDRDGNQFQDQKMWPIVDDAKDENGYHTGKNYVDKIVTVTVNGDSEPTYLRTYIAIPAQLDDGPTTFDASLNVVHWNGASANDSFGAANDPMDNDWYWTTNLSSDWPSGTEWNGYVTKIDGVDYNVYVATHKGIVAPGVTTGPSLMGVYVDERVDYDDIGYFYMVDGKREPIDDILANFKILVATEAVQSDGFDELTGIDNAIYALDSAFGYVGKHCPFGGTIIDVFDATEAATAAAVAAAQ